MEYEIIEHGPGGHKDNSIGNLSLSDHVHNARNRKMLDSNTSGYTGVGWDKKNKYWEARIYHNKKQIKATFEFKEDAIEQRLKWEVEFNYRRRQSRS